MKASMKKYIFPLFILFPALIGASFLSAHAQTDPAELVFTWNAENFYPANYPGKAYATEGSPVTVSAEMLQGGRFLDVSEANVKWYLDNKLYAEGRGLKEIQFTAKSRRGSSHIVRALFERAGVKTEASVQIPVRAKEVVVESSAPSGSVPANSSVSLLAVPYFWNVSALSDLRFSWRIDNRDIPNENEQSLFIQFGAPKAGSGTVRITSLATTKVFSLEKARFDTTIQVTQ
jgi:hypothetical protein